jgi:hypothetical protein
MKSILKKINYAFSISIEKNNKQNRKKKRGISYDFDQNNYMFWKLVNSFKMMK